MVLSKRALPKYGAFANELYKDTVISQKSPTKIWCVSKRALQKYGAFPE